MKYCTKCGAEMSDDQKFCTCCGTEAREGVPSAGADVINSSYHGKERSVIAVVIFSLITCGIYSLYWYYVTAEDFNRNDSKEPLMNFLAAFLLGIITCGIFLIYWEYKFFSKGDKVTRSNNCILNFILSLFGFSIVSMAIQQDSINKALHNDF